MSPLFFAIAKAFPQELISHLASRMGEGKGAMKCALEGVLPVMLGGLARQAEAADAQLLFEWTHRAYQNTPYVLGSVTGMLGILGSGNAAGSAMMQGETLLLALFGTSWHSIAASVSRYAQVKRSTANTLLMLVGAVLPGLLGQYAERNRLSPAAVTAKLVSIKNQLNILLPIDLKAVADTLGLTAEARSGPPLATGALEAKSSNWHGRLASWTLVLLAVLGIAHALPVVSLPVVQGDADIWQVASELVVGLNAGW